MPLACSNWGSSGVMPVFQAWFAMTMFSVVPLYLSLMPAAPPVAPPAAGVVAAPPAVVAVASPAPPVAVVAVAAVAPPPVAVVAVASAAPPPVAGVLVSPPQPASALPSSVKATAAVTSLCNPVDLYIFPLLLEIWNCDAVRGVMSYRVVIVRCADWPAGERWAGWL